jgi:hypothetical protein
MARRVSGDALDVFVVPAVKSFKAFLIIPLPFVLNPLQVIRAYIQQA